MAKHSCDSKISSPGSAVPLRIHAQRASGAADAARRGYRTRARFAAIDEAFSASADSGYRLETSAGPTAISAECAIQIAAHHWPLEIAISS
jgi:hypothetical protein